MQVHIHQIPHCSRSQVQRTNLLKIIKSFASQPIGMVETHTQLANDKPKQTALVYACRRQDNCQDAIAMVCVLTHATSH